MVTDRDAWADRCAGTDPRIRLDRNRQIYQILVLFTDMVDRYENNAGPNHCERFYVDATARFEKAPGIHERAFAEGDVAGTEHRLVAEQLRVALNLYPSKFEQPHTDGDEAGLG